ncbi:hypothetical protein NL676_034953 [Syzygium grande]|nr:hypothetical protein NL676_034953 [Syzygium grande]
MICLLGRRLTVAFVLLLLLRRCAMQQLPRIDPETGAGFERTAPIRRAPGGPVILTVRFFHASSDDGGACANFLDVSIGFC